MDHNLRNTRACTRVLRSLCLTRKPTLAIEDVTEEGAKKNALWRCDDGDAPMIQKLDYWCSCSESLMHRLSDLGMHISEPSSKECNAEVKQHMTVEDYAVQRAIEVSRICGTYTDEPTLKLWQRWTNHGRSL